MIKYAPRHPILDTDKQQVHHPRKEERKTSQTRLGMLRLQGLVGSYESEVAHASLATDASGVKIGDVRSLEQAVLNGSKRGTCG